MACNQIYEIIEKDDGSSLWSHLYDILMFCDAVYWSSVTLTTVEFRPLRMRKN